MNRGTSESRDTASVADVEVVVHGAVPADARTAAEQMVGALARYGHEPILHARVRLTESADPRLARPLIAQANLDVNGRMVRAQVAAPTAHEGIDLLEAKLRRQLGRAARDWEARRGAQPTGGAHEWRHGSEPADRPDYFPRAVDERQVIRHKSFELATATPDEAAFDLDLMDYQFHLFTDVESGQDSVIYHAGATGYRLAQIAPDPGRTWTTAVPLTMSEQPAPRLTEASAMDRLDATGLPFVFYADEASGRGHVLYRRYDGHYGLITPVA